MGTFNDPCMDDETNIWLVAGNVDIMVGHELFLAFELAIDDPCIVGLLEMITYRQIKNY